MIVIDGMSDFYRHYWKMQRIVGPFVAGFMGMIRGTFSYKKEDKDVRIVWEGKSTIRKEINVTYKGDRKRMPEQFYEQLNDTQSFLSNFFKQYMVEGYESDDLCATIAYKRDRMNKTTKIVSGDGDLHQMINQNIRVYNPAQKITLWTDNFKDKYGDKLLSHHLLGLWSLEGDASDNIVGIKGLRGKSELAAAYYPDHGLMITDIEFEDIFDRFYKALFEDKKNIMSPKDKAKIQASKQIIYNNMNLLRLRMVPKENYIRIETRDKPKALIEKYKCFKSLTGYLEEPNENQPTDN
jgi:DNA polymerase-1